MKKAPFIFCFAIGHLILSVGVMVESFSMGMRRFDTEEAATLTEVFLRKLSIVLWMPLGRPIMEFSKWWMSVGPAFSGLVQYILLFLNSLIWGYAAWWIYSKIKEKRQRSAV